MAAARSHPGTAGAIAALALAGFAALLLGLGDRIGFGSAGTEALFVAVWLLGWTLLSWASILGGIGVTQLVRRLVSGTNPAWSEGMLVVAGAAAVIVVISAHPLWGSGSGLG